MTLRWVLKYDWEVRTVLVWLWTGTGEHGYETSGSIKD
jgi:hypothetical protein